MKFVTCRRLGGSFCDFEAYGYSGSDIKERMLDHLQEDHLGEFMSEDHARVLEKKMDRVLFSQD